jgi:dienelactone hydrolase
MSYIFKTTGISGITSEKVTVRLPTNWKPDGTKLAVVLAEGYTNDDMVLYNPAQLELVSQAITDAGYAVINSQFATNAFGNSASRSAITNAISYVRTKYGAHATKVALAGFSMGTLNVLSWAGNNASQVACVTGWCPPTDLQLAAGISSFTAAVNAAYGGLYVEATYGATCNPKTMASAHNYGSIPIQLRYSSDDSLITTASVTSFVTAVNNAACTSTNAGTGGHSYIRAYESGALTALITQLNTAQALL